MSSNTAHDTEDEFDKYSRGQWRSAEVSRLGGPTS